MRSLLFWAAIPFLLPQALIVRKTAPRFAGALGPHEGSVGEGRELSLLALGDSIISGVGAKTLSTALVGQVSLALSESLRCKVNWRALGSTGATAKSVLYKLIPMIRTTSPAVIILSVGVNDVTSLSTVSAWKKNLAAIIRLLVLHSPNAAIVITGIPPLDEFPLLPQPLRAVFGFRGRSFQMASEKIAAKFPQAILVPVDFEKPREKLSADGFHPSEAGYAEFGRVIGKKIALRFNWELSSLAATSRIQRD